MASFFWIGGAGAFDSASNWDAYTPDTDDPSGYGVAIVAPGPADIANIDTDAGLSGSGEVYQVNIYATVTISAPLTTTVTAYTIIGPGGPSGPGSGSVTVSSTWHNTSFLAIGNYAPGSLTIDAGGSVQNDGELGVGQFSGGTGTLTIEGGGTLTSGGPFNVVGNTTGSLGMATIMGAGSSWSMNGWLGVGNKGTGELTVSDGGSLVTAGPYDELGIAAGSSGEVTIDGSGSTWQSGGGLIGTSSFALT
jgi:T5SS/PEP-CTERM-associated repeat protein